MKLLYSSSSPFVRKVTLVAQALGLEGRIERLPSAANPLKRDPRITAHNPLGKVPCLITDDGLAVIDSKVIVEYLCAMAPDDRVLPRQGAERWIALRQQAIADGAIEAAVGLRYEEAVRPADRRWAEWGDGLMSKIDAALLVLEQEFVPPRAEGVLGVGTLAAVALLGYLDFRFADRQWRKERPALAAAYELVLKREDVRASEPFVAT